MIKVFDNVKKVVVNKIERPFDKDNKPFVYNGTTYVPLRFVEDVLGEAVNWDGKTGTIYIGESPYKNASYWSKELVLMNHNRTVIQSYDSQKYIEDNMGNKYNNYFYLEEGGWLNIL